MKRILIVAFLSTLACSPVRKDAPGWDVIIKGRVGFPQKGTISITETRQDAQTPVEDTIHLKSNYSFEKRLRITEPGYYRLNFYGRQTVNLILDRSTIEINADGNSQSGFAEVKGSPDLDLISLVRGMIEKGQSAEQIPGFQKDIDEAVKSRNEKRILELQQTYRTSMEKVYASVADILEREPPSLGLIYLLRSNATLDKDKYFSVYIAVAEKFKKEWPGNYYANEFVSFVESLKRTAIGQPAPEISMPDPDGRIFTLSSMKGKYVLVDFWAKWCGPCRQENPNVVRAYNEFKGKGFDILGVSLDRSKEEWMQAIAEDGLTWHHVSDLAYFNSKAAKDYNITGIPFSILVDPDGIIIAKNLRGLDLQKKLTEVLNKKPE
jgi:peroxiredoxin